MEISRPHINYKELVEFPIEERFLKLPIDKFLDIQGIKPIAPQIALINAINSAEFRFVVACLSRRTGKTFISNTLAFLKAMEPGVKILIVSPNFSLTNISWNEQIKVLKEHDIEVESKSKTSREIWLCNGSMIKFGSCNNPDSLVGHSYDLILMDEAALDANGGSVFNVQLRPTLDKPNSKIIFISTPRGLNWYKEFYDRGFSADFGRWASIHSTWRDNPRANEEDIEEARRAMSKAEFAQEMEASFLTFEGQIYESFDPDKHVRDLSMYDFNQPYRWDTIMGIDPGYKDHTGGVVLKYDTEEDIFYAVWDYQVCEALTSDHAKAFGHAYERYGVDMVFCDSAAAQFRQDMAVEYDLPSSKAKKSVLDGIACLQSLIEDDKLIVDPTCEALINMLINYRWNPSENLVKPKPLHDEFSHVADALRYALYSYRR